MSRRSPNLFLNIWNNFVLSFKKKPSSKLMGSDYLGNKYYEIDAKALGKNKPTRWFENEKGEAGFDRDRPAEWESWLRFRRGEPPTDEEINKNLAIMQMKKINAAELDKKYSDENKVKELPKDVKGFDSFPKYDEYK